MNIFHKKNRKRVAKYLTRARALNRVGSRFMNKFIIEIWAAHLGGALETRTVCSTEIELLLKLRTGYGCVFDHYLTGTYIVWTTRKMIP